MDIATLVLLEDRVNILLYQFMLVLQYRLVLLQLIFLSYMHTTSRNESESNKS